MSNPVPGNQANSSIVKGDLLGNNSKPYVPVSHPSRLTPKHWQSLLFSLSLPFLSLFLTHTHALFSARHPRHVCVCARAASAVEPWSTYSTWAASVNLTDVVCFGKCRVSIHTFTVTQASVCLWVCMLCVCVFPHTDRWWKAMQCCLGDRHKNIALTLSAYSHTHSCTFNHLGLLHRCEWKPCTPTGHMEDLCWKGRA